MTRSPLAHSSRREMSPDFFAMVEATPIDDLPRLIGDLAGAQALALKRLAAPPPTPVVKSALLTAPELAESLNVSESWVRSAARRQQIPCVHAGVHLRFDLADVLAAMKTGKAALPDREKLSERGRRAVEHRIVNPVDAKKRRPSKEAATAVLPQQDGEFGGARVTLA